MAKRLSSSRSTVRDRPSFVGPSGRRVGEGVSEQVAHEQGSLILVGKAIDWVLSSLR